MGKNRIIEIDFIRSLAIVLMVSYHIAYDLKEFAGINIPYESNAWFLVGKTSLILFIFVSGISSIFSKNTTKRGFKILFLGMIITAITYIIFPKDYIRFGVLHFLGICIIIAPFLKRINNYLLFITAAFSLILGFYFDNIVSKTWILIPFGILYDGFSTLDYVPLFPYLSVYILGVLFAKKFYTEKKSLFNLDLDFRFISCISKNSLLIYIIHQPVIYFTIFTLTKIIIK
ncbi:Uncharacterized membrane protein [Caloramator quimbayensis]|uniref:Uncharacterized membrane protein n=1 Tax=Caloramator quimbayensis TaxID=1147123 RepID=A0A1T4X5J8_9CLOT|nr:heparan-alpha-glucosaminide N-acetyltransferase [Caloramator quimbayensis]SKA84903.1 Uncharacterized membrane protein [Caloramator quimbayensis]